MENNETPAWAKRLEERLDKFESGKANESRLQKLESRLEGMHDSVKKTTLTNFKYTKFASDEEFESYLNDIGPIVDTANQTVEGQAMTDAVSRFADMRKRGETNALPGRDVQEDPNVTRTRMDKVSGGLYGGKEI